MNRRTVLVLYDGRAKTGDTGRAAVFSTASTEDEARAEGETYWAGYDAIWAEVVVEDGRQVSERLRWDLPPAIDM